VERFESFGLLHTKLRELVEMRMILVFGCEDGHVSSFLWIYFLVLQHKK